MRTTLILILISVFQGIGYCQNTKHEVFPAAGDYFLNQQMQISWTLGEVIPETFSGQTLKFTQGFQQSDQFRDLGGLLRYDNTFLSPLSNSTVRLKSGATLVAQSNTNQNGGYLFHNLQNGSYQLIGSTLKPWGGGNATDALVIMKHFTNIAVLQGIRLMAADVDASGYVNTTDALQVMKRFVAMQSSFPSGDWLFETHTVQVDGFNNLTDHVKGLCVGDVDGSYIPGLKSDPSLSLHHKGVLKAKYHEEMVVPVSWSDNTHMNALSLVLYYPVNQIDVLSASIPGEDQNMVYTCKNGEIRIAWNSLTPKFLLAEEPFLFLHLRVNNSYNSSGNSINFMVGAESNAADSEALTLFNKSLEIPVLIPEENGFYLGQNQPNPGSDLTSFTYSLPEAGLVQLFLTNPTGQRIRILLEKEHTAGDFSFPLDCKEIPAGVYVYTMHFTAQSGDYQISKRMLIVH